MAKCEGSNVTVARGRVDCAENLYEEAQASFEKNEYTTIKPRITAARNWIKRVKRSPKLRPQDKNSVFL
jgi:hypothetical protein